MSMGTDFLVNSMIKALNLDPEEIKKQIATIFTIAVQAHQTVLRIEANQIEILSLLKDGKGMTPDEQPAITHEKDIQ